MPLISNSPASPKLVKRKAEYDDCHTSPNKRSKNQPILEWLSDTESLRRSTSAPPCFDLDMPSQPQAPVFVRPQTPAISAISSVSTKTKTDDPNYRSILHGNGIYMDRSEEELQPKEIQEFLTKHILKPGTASRPAEELHRISQSIKVSLDGSENVVLKTFQSSLFSILPNGIVSGGNVPWSEQPLPRIATFWGALSIPKPDVHFGYPAGQGSNFTSEQNGVITHPFAVNFTQPTSDNSFPFLLVEAKSEFKGGTLYHAENQAAGGGAHRVNSLRWLHRTAGVEEDVLQSLSFSMCVTGRAINLYIHYYSEEKKFVMSCIRSYIPARPADIQDCLWHIENIMGFALETRRKEIEASLDLLYPMSEAWPRKRRTGSRSSSRSASVSAPSIASGR